MKKTLTYSIICFALMLLNYGCKVDPVIIPAEIATTSKIVGRWKVQTDDVKIFINSVQTGGGLITYGEGEAFMEFKANGTGDSSDGPFKYTVAGNIVTVTDEPNQDFPTGEVIALEIKELSDHKMVLYMDFSFTNAQGLINGNTVLETLAR